MKKQSIFALFLVVLALSACKPPKEFIQSLTVTPSPLENHAGKVEVTIDGSFPVKYFTKNMIMTVTPVLKSKTSDAVFKAEPVIYQGEKVKDNNQVISYKMGGKYSQKAVFTYDPAMESSELWVEVQCKIKDKVYDLPAEKIADGVNITPLLVSANAGTGDLTSQIEADKFQRIIQERQEAEIRFLIQKSDIRKSELKSEGVINLTKKIQMAKDSQNLEMKGLEISSYASPDGGVDLNEKLASARDKSSVKYINNELKKLKAEVTISSKFTAEDWDGFQKLMEESDIQDKQLILRVLSMYSDSDQREKEIKNLSTAFKVIADDILPQLRRSKMTLLIDVIGKSDEEIASLAAQKSKDLSIEEVLYAATLTNDLNQKAEIYLLATENYPEDYRGFNNLASVKYELGQVDEAERCAAKALELNAKCVNANFNAGLVALAKGDDAKAEEYFGNAGGVGAALDCANGVLAIKKADYKKAVSLFGDAKINNAALAKILTKDYTGARTVLESVENPNATTSYLLAVVGARTNDRTLASDNLKKAIEQNADFKAKAAKDIEFAEFMKDEAFAAIVK
jgi:tetratricopeptide (TPR) repeat protein